tara:strand:- start:11059 stop:11244 length:186 start_codon:yes stop_codon:yes gene_type:complete
MQQDEKLLQMRIERTEKTTREDIKKLYITINRMAENLGFNVIAPKSNEKHLAFKGEERDGR